MFRLRSRGQGFRFRTRDVSIIGQHAATPASGAARGWSRCARGRALTVQCGHAGRRAVVVVMVAAVLGLATPGAQSRSQGDSTRAGWGRARCGPGAGSGGHVC